MSTEISRRKLLTQLAAAGAAAAVMPASANADTAKPNAMTSSPRSLPAALTPIPLPDKLKATEANGITFKTHQAHYGLYTGYVKKVNEINAKLVDLGLPDPKAANQTFSDIRELKVEYSFAIGGVKNHELYFSILGGTGGTPSGDLAAAIAKDFGSWDVYVADLKATAIAARGWAWTALDLDLGTLFNYAGDAQNTFPVWSAVPILGLDVYEHAYIADFSTARAKYIDAFLASLDWGVVADKYATAVRKQKA
jgi:Fe-Mn family superoxide dismutase